MTINKQSEEQFKQINSKLEQLTTHNRILETQITQQASTSNSKTMEKLPSQPEFALKETCQVITLRSGKEVEKVSSKNKRVVEDDDMVEAEASKGNENGGTSG